MSQSFDFNPAGAPFDQYKTLSVSSTQNVWHVQLQRPEKRNALSDSLIAELQHCFSQMPENIRAVVLSGQGKHFCAGLDLSELSSHGAAGGVAHSRMWHAAFDQIQYGRAPVVAVLNGAVIGGGLELASACHLRVAEESAFFALPEGQRGLFLGGGGSVRISRLIGVSRVTDLMLTGRRFDAAQAESVGLVNYQVEPDQGLETAFAMAHRIAKNSPMSNYAVMHALPRIAEQGPNEGLFTESLMAAVAQSDDDAKARMQAFLDGRAEKVKPAGEDH